EMSQPGDVLPRHPASRAAVGAFGSGKYSRLITDILYGRRPEGVGGELPGFGQDLLAALVDRASADRHRPGVERALAEFRSGGVPFDDVDVVRAETDRVGGVRGEGGGVPRAWGGGAAVPAARAGGMDEYAGIFPAAIGKTRRGVVPAGAEPGEFGVGGQPDAPVAAVAAQLCLL